LKIIRIALLLAAAVPAAAVILPLRIPFQGKLLDPATNNPKNGAFSMQFKLYTVPTGGAALFAETQSVTVVNGVFNVQIGTISLLTTDLFSGASAYLGVTVGGDAEMLPRQPLSMSPYAFTAMQLVNDQDVRVNAGITYSTFSANGNLLLQYGIAGSTANFMTVTSTNVGTFGIVTSSGIDMGAGTLLLESDSRGIDATGTGIVASTGAFVKTTSQISLGAVTSSTTINSPAPASGRTLTIPAAGGDGQFVVTAGTGNEALRIIRGRISATATILQGTGFSVARTGGGGAAGDYTVTFTSAYSAIPTITATSEGTAAGSRPLIAQLNAAPTATTVRVLIQLGNANGTTTDAPFSFIAIGPP
jgi:hypothetical protein